MSRNFPADGGASARPGVAVFTATPRTPGPMRKNSKRRTRLRKVMGRVQGLQEAPREYLQEYPHQEYSPSQRDRQVMWPVHGSQEIPQKYSEELFQSPHGWVWPEQRQWQIDRQAMRPMQAPQDYYPRARVPEAHWRGHSYYWSPRSHTPVCGLSDRRNWFDDECSPLWRDSQCFQPPHLAYPPDSPPRPRHLEYPPNSPPWPRPYGEAANLDYTAMRTSRSNAAQLKLSGTNLQHPTRTFKKVKRRAQPKEKSQQPPLTPPTIPCFEPDDLLLARPVENAAIPLSVSVVCETPVPSTETKGLTETSCKHVIETESETGMTDEITETHKTDLTDLEKLEVSVKSDDVSIEAGQPIVDAPAAMDLSDINSEEKFSLNQDVVRREEVSFNDSLNSLIAKEKSNLSTFDKHTSIHGNIHDHSNHDRPTSETQCTVICTRLDNDVNDKSFLTSEDQLSSVRNDLFSVTDSCSATAVDDSSSPGNQLLYNNVPHMTDKELTKCDSPNACEESDLNAVQYSISCEPVGLYSPKHSSVLVDLVTPPQLPVEEKSLSNDELQAISQTIDLTHSPCDELRIISIKSVESAPDALPVIDLTTSPVATSSEATSQRLPASTDLGITPIPLPNDTRAGASASPTHPPHAPLVGATDQLEGRGKKRPAQEDALGPSVTWKRPRLEHGGVHIPLADALNKLCAAGSVLIYKTGTSLNEQTDVQRSWVLSCQFPPRGLSEPPFTLVDLPFECREFQELETFFQKTCANKYFSVESIKRMENISLIHRFREKVKNLERRCENVAVVRLFHGTLKENISSICLGNLDLRLAGTSTSHTWWGAGVNFSPISYYASHYGDQGRLRSMLVCEVAVGNVCSLRQPKSGRPGEGYDTNIKLPQPQVVCKFDDDEFYPSYVIDYVVPPNHQGLKYDELLDFYGNSRYNFDESYYSTQYYGNYYNDYYD